MRVTQSTHSGFFWLPSTPDHKLPGTLTVLPDGAAKLLVLGHFGGPNANLFDEPEVSRIVGNVDDWGAVTLDGCFVTAGSKGMGGLVKMKLHVHKIIAGLLFDQNEPVRFDRLEFSVDGLNEWLGMTGFEISHDFETPRSTYAYQKPNSVEFDLGNEITGSLDFTCRYPGRAESGVVTITDCQPPEHCNPVPFRSFSSLS